MTTLDTETDVKLNIYFILLIHERIFISSDQHLVTPTIRNTVSGPLIIIIIGLRSVSASEDVIGDPDDWRAVACWVVDLLDIISK